MGMFDDLNNPPSTGGGMFTDLQSDASTGGASGSWDAPISTAQKFGKGLRDPIDGGAQLLTNLLPASVVNAGNTANNWLADKTGLVGRLPVGGVDAQVRSNEKTYQAQRTAAGESGFDGVRLLGNVLNPANIGIGAAIPQAASLGGRVALGALGGAASGAMNPVTDGDFAAEKQKQIALGGAFGGAVPAVTGMGARMISPNASTNPNLALLKSEGVKPTIGQSLGGWANSAEEKMQLMPIIGDAITAARKGTWDQLNRAAFNRALEPIGQKLPMTTALGNDSVLYTRKALGDAYENLLPKLTAQADDTFAAKIGSLKTMVSEGALDPKYMAQFDKTLKNRVIDKFQGQNSMSGETIKDTQSFLNKEIERFGASQDPDARLIGQAYKEVQSELRGLIQRSNPKQAGELKAIDTAYANFKRVQKAAASLGADEGVFTPAQLQNAVKAADRSKDKARFAEGNALMQDLSSAGKSVLGNRINDSGTAGRLAFGAGALGTGALNPAIPAGLLGGAAMYSSPMQSLLRGMVSSRPQGSQSVADAFRQSAPFLVPAGAQMGLGLLD